jgi:hypothetical protein
MRARIEYLHTSVHHTQCRRKQRACDTTRRGGPTGAASRLLISHQSRTTDIASITPLASQHVCGCARREHILYTSRLPHAMPTQTNTYACVLTNAPAKHSSVERTAGTTPQPWRTAATPASGHHTCQPRYLAAPLTTAATGRISSTATSCSNDCHGCASRRASRPLCSEVGINR